MSTFKERERSRINYHKRFKLKKCQICGKEFRGKDKQKNCLEHKRLNKETTLSSKRIVIKKCKICKKEFYGKNAHCSKECYNVYLEQSRKRIYKKCSCCGKDIIKHKCQERKRNFCNRRCWFKYKKNLPNFKIRKEKHPQWKGGKIRRNISTIKYKRWRESIYKRDQYKCVFCGENNNIVAHHIIAWNDGEKFRFYKTNGITLCKKCHKKIHNNNFLISINYEYTKNKCKNEGIKLRKKISDRIEEFIQIRRNRDCKK